MDVRLHVKADPQRPALFCATRSPQKFGGHPANAATGVESSLAVAPGPPLLVPSLDRALNSHCDCHEVVMHEEIPELLAKADKGCNQAK